MASSIYISVRWNPLYEVSPPLPPLKPHPNLGSPLTRLTGRTLLLATFRTPRDLENSFLGVKPSCSRSWAEEIQKKRKRRNLGSSNILKIFKLNIPFHRVTISYLYINTDSIYEGRVSPTNLSPRSWIRTVYTMNPQTRVIVYANSSVNSGRRPDCRIGKR